MRPCALSEWLHVVPCPAAHVTSGGKHAAPAGRRTSGAHGWLHHVTPTLGLASDPLDSIQRKLHHAAPANVQAANARRSAPRHRMRCAGTTPLGPRNLIALKVRQQPASHWRPSRRSAQEGYSLSGLPRPLQLSVTLQCALLTWNAPAALRPPPPPPPRMLLQAPGRSHRAAKGLFQPAPLARKTGFCYPDGGAASAAMAGYSLAAQCGSEIIATCFTICACLAARLLMWHAGAL